jgi:hypothetical protein
VSSLWLLAFPAALVIGSALLTARPKGNELLADAIEALRANAEGLREQGFNKWAETTEQIADELERRG